MSRLIYLVTHGEKEEGPNPGLTARGRKQAQQLRQFLPQTPHSIVCGMGRRHCETAQELELWPADRHSSVFGVPESKNRAKGTIWLVDGTEIPYGKYTFVEERKRLFLEEVAKLPSRTVVITSRPMIKILGFAGDSKEAGVYRYDPDSGEITEIFAASDDIGAGDQEV